MKNRLAFMVTMSIVLSVVLITIGVSAQEESGMDALDASIQAALEELKRIYSTEIIMGTPMEVNELKIIPLAIAGFGFGQQGGVRNTLERSKSS